MESNKDELDAVYKQMAADKEREAEALALAKIAISGLMFNNFL